MDGRPQPGLRNGKESPHITFSAAAAQGGFVGLMALDCRAAHCLLPIAILDRLCEAKGIWGLLELDRAKYVGKESSSRYWNLASPNLSSSTQLCWYQLLGPA